MSAACRRREFLAGAASLLPFARPLSAAAGEPLLRIGLMTDTHVGDTVESCLRVRMALELFKAHGAELVINNGDIADRFSPDGYAAYRRVSEDVYGGTWRPKELFAYAWHDAFAYKGHPRGMATADGPAAFEDVRRLLKAPNGHTAEVRFKGFTFLVMPQFTGSEGFLSWEEYEAKVAEACKANPGRPVFVVDHVPPEGTVYNSWDWGKRKTREILNRYPQTVVFSGHVHGSLRNDVLIWQGEFTVINAGCLQKWSGLLAGNVPEAKQSFGVLTVDVHPDRLAIRRWDVRDGREIDPGHPWIVPLPFDAGSAPYDAGRRRATHPAPQFPSGATVSAVPRGSPFSGFRIEFPDAAGRAMKYRISMLRKGAAGGWKPFAAAEVFSGYWKAPRDRAGRIDFLCGARYFDPGAEYAFEVFPVGQYGAAGEPIRTVAKAPDRFAPASRIFLSEDPARELEFQCKTEDGDRRCMADAEGFFGPEECSRIWLRLPEGIFAGPAGTRFTAALDIRTVQAEEASHWSICFRDPEGKRPGASPRIKTPGGDSGDARYLLELVKAPGNSGTYHIQFDRGIGGRVKLERLEIVRQPPVSREHGL